jgi:hypothetical protein
MLVTPFLAIHTKHVYTCQMNVLQVSYDQICSDILRDTWFEVFGSKIPFLHVLHCHNSPQRARRQNRGSCSPPTRSCEQLLAMASKLTREASRQCNCTVCLFRVMLTSSGSSFLQAVFHKSKPLKLRS